MLRSRLPQVGTTIFTVMSALAARHGAVNLGQGFPDFGCDPRLIEAVAQAMRDGHNQYPPMSGWRPLREAIAQKIERLYGRRYDVDTEITVTAGATQGLFTTIMALVHPGDEVIVIEPAYDSYAPAIELAGATARFVTMERSTDADARGAGSFVIPWDRVRAAVTDRTRLIVLNSPNNPTGMTITASDLEELATIVITHGLFVLSDEVYEHMVFDGASHQSASRHAALAERTVVVSSFGKTFHVTGWKIGYVAAPAALTDEFRKVHQFNVFTVNTPMQAAIAAFLDDPDPYLGLSAFYQSKRDAFCNGLAKTKLRPLRSQGTYFVLTEYDAVRDDLSDLAFCEWLVSAVGVAAIPLSAFYAAPTESRLIRFCFAKKPETLNTALERLATL